MALSANSLYAAGREWFSRRGTLRQAIAGGITEMVPTAAHSTIGQRGAATIQSITGELQPPTDADAPWLRSLLKTPGIIPIILPDGARYAVRNGDEGASIAGYYENHTDAWAVNWIVQNSVVMADLPWAGSYPGERAYHRLGTLPYVYAGATLIANSGWQLTGNGSSWASYIRERDAGSTPRPQPTLYAEITMGAGSVAGIGMQPQSSPVSSTNVFGDAPGGIGMQLDTANAYFYDGKQAYTLFKAGVPTGKWYISLTARPFGARLEAWRSATSFAGRRNDIYWMPQASPMTAIITCFAGTITLNRWWISN